MRETLHALPRAPGRRAPERTGRGRKILLWMAMLAALWLVAVSRVYVNASWSDGAWGYFVLPLVESSNGATRSCSTHPRRPARGSPTSRPCAACPETGWRWTGSAGSR